jgi:hypothetical protein
VKGVPGAPPCPESAGWFTSARGSAPSQSLPQELLPVGRHRFRCLPAPLYRWDGSERDDVPLAGTEGDSARRESREVLAQEGQAGTRQEPARTRGWVGGTPRGLCADSTGTRWEPRHGTLCQHGPVSVVKTQRKRGVRQGTMPTRSNRAGPNAGLESERRPGMTWIRRSSWQCPTSSRSPPRRPPMPSASSPP